MKDWQSAIILSTHAAGDLVTSVNYHEPAHYFNAVNAEEDSIR